MSNFLPAFDFMIPHEGGYSSDPDDPGGETKFGISKRSYPQLDISCLTSEDAKAIYLRDFWEPYPYQLIDDQGVANKTFDFAVNMGHKEAAVLLQRACNDAGGLVVVDGEVGPITIKAVNLCDPPQLLNSLKDKAVEFYMTLASNKPELRKFLDGWVRRARE